MIKATKVIRKLKHKIAPGPVPLEGTEKPYAEHDHFPRLNQEAQHPSAWAFPAYLSDQVPWVASLKRIYADPVAFPASLSPEAGLLLHSIVRNCRPKTVLEVGTFCSVSTHWIAAALAETSPTETKKATTLGTVHCFDDFGPVYKGPHRNAEMPDGRLGYVRDRLTDANLIGRCRFYPGDSSTNIKQQSESLKNAGGIDLAFIDGDHSVVGAQKDFLAVEPLLNTGAHVILHDTFPDQCGDHLGPRSIIDNLTQMKDAVKRRLGMRLPAHYVYENATDIGQGVYQKMELYLAPLNYGLAVLRRVG